MDEKTKILIQSRDVSTNHMLELLDFVSETKDTLVYKLITPYSFRISTNPETDEIEWIDLSSGPMITLGYTLNFFDGNYELFKIELSEQGTLLKFKLV